MDYWMRDAPCISSSTFLRALSLGRADIKACYSMTRDVAKTPEITIGACILLLWEGFIPLFVFVAEDFKGCLFS